LVREGSIFTTIAEVAGDIGASLIYLGTHGKSGIQKLTGSFAIKVVTSSEVPVVVVQKRPFQNGYKDIVLPITSEAGPLEKTRWAAFMAKTFGARVHIFQIDESPEIMETVKSLEDFLKKEDVVSRTVVAGRSAGFSRQVLDYATSNNADLILIMTSPDKNWTSFLLGTYDEEVIFNTSQIPVMCINPRKYNWEKIFRS
ncbi:MAG TPA: universal stress protein, partial [Bacteroidales bacterium]|nr:universal stress protein [Bacteroidales bacterium]